MTPRLYQLKAVDSLRSGSILCGGVGSGKSYTALLYFWTKEMDGIRKGSEYVVPSKNKRKDLYIITTARKRDTGEWEVECASFGIGTAKSSPIKVTIDSWNNIQKYLNVKDAFFIFDEQRAVGSGTWAKSFIKIAKANRWIMLSATPGDTWIDYIPVFVANGYYKNRTAFMREHVVVEYAYGKYPKIKMYLNEHKLNWLRNQVLVDMDYAKETKRHQYWVKSTYDPTLYSIVWKRRWNVYEDKPIENLPELFMCLRKTVNQDDSRIDILTDIVKLHKKAIVFYNFDYELDILRKYCKDRRIVYSEWNGHHHQMIPESDAWLYLVQYTAGAEGWNCISTDTVIFYSLNYSYKIVEQAMGRIDRCNTPFSDLYYYFLYSSSSIDHGIKKALDNKKTFNEKAFMEKHSKI
jgi:superfamily II DNA or RNA helicase